VHATILNTLQRSVSRDATTDSTQIQNESQYRKSSNKPPWRVIYALDFCMETYSGGAYLRGWLPRREGLFKGRSFNIFLLVEHISFEIGLPISYFLMLQIQATWCFLKDVRYFVNKWLNFLSYLYKALIKSQIATVTCLGGAFSRGLINNFSSGVGTYERGRPICGLTVAAFISNIARPQKTILGVKNYKAKVS